MRRLKKWVHAPGDEDTNFTWSKAGGYEGIGLLFDIVNGFF
jgi:hypothetical protein